MEQTPCNGILYGKHSYYCRISFYIFEHLLKGGTAYNLYLLSFEVLMGSYVVERTNFSLYRYSFHISNIDVANKKPASLS